MLTHTLSTTIHSWSWQPHILLGLGAAAAGYAWGFYHLWRRGALASMFRRGLIRRSHPWYFTSGLVILFITLLSPIDALADRLFLMHMAQHLLLIMVVPPLLLLGLPAPLVRGLILEIRLKDVLDRLTNPILAYMLFNANIWLWHVPTLYDLALRNEIIHDIEHALFFYTAMLFWWRIFDPTRGWFPLWGWPPAKWLYLLVTAPPSFVLGSVLWANGAVLYTYYTQVPRLWGLSALEDQQYGGLLMWLQSWMYLMASMIVFFIWYDPEAEL